MKIIMSATEIAAFENELKSFLYGAGIGEKYELIKDGVEIEIDISEKGNGSTELTTSTGKLMLGLDKNSGIMLGTALSSIVGLLKDGTEVQSVNAVAGLAE